MITDVSRSILAANRGLLLVWLMGLQFVTVSCNGSFKTAGCLHCLQYFGVQVLCYVINYLEGRVLAGDCCFTSETFSVMAAATPHWVCVERQWILVKLPLCLAHCDSAVFALFYSHMLRFRHWTPPQDGNYSH